ncbi:MAG: hypothetical protein AAF512_25925, partial [Pseudomonadota bacterium]
AEVEESIRLGGQSFASTYVDNENAFGSGQALSSWYLGIFPTRDYYAQHTDLSAFSSERDYLDTAFSSIINLGKTFNIEIWDSFENMGEADSAALAAADLNWSSFVFNVNSLFKNNFADAIDFASGRVVVDSAFNDPLDSSQASSEPNRQIWPGLFYTFETKPDFTAWGHWRRLQR